MRYITLYFQNLCPKIGRCCRILYWTDVRYDSMSGLYSLYLSDGRKSLLTANSQIRSPVLAVDFAGALLASESLSFIIIIIIIIIIRIIIVVVVVFVVVVTIKNVITFFLLLCFLLRATFALLRHDRTTHQRQIRSL